ncbi:MAG TPA: sensor histidine kinase [Lysobacter sp.]|jgi:two-component system sensor histidine kinase DesK|nr:sensor histidine kinase [Lysobacter sp.]
MFNLFKPSDNSLLGEHGRRQHLSRLAHWWPGLNLLWSIWIFLTPLSSTHVFPHWQWPTLTSYVAFLLLYFCAYYRNRRWMGACALGIALLGFALAPWNPGAQGYLIYSCAFLASVARPKRALLAMTGVMAAFSVEWLLLDYYKLYLLSTVVIGYTVGLMNLAWAREMRADVALRLSHDEVRRLAGLAERERIGRDLHDLLGHTLSLVALKSELAGKLVERDPLAARRELADVSRVAREALTQVRSAVTGIRAAGLAAELASARLLLEADAIVFRYELAPVLLPPELETVLALCVREAVTNIQRHARAQHAGVKLTAADDVALLQIEDDGRGGALVPGNGLKGMRERIEALGGSLQIYVAQPRGTRLEVRLPLPAPAPRMIEAPGAVAA